MLLYDECWILYHYYINSRTNGMTFDNIYRTKAQATEALSEYRKNNGESHIKVYRIEKWIKAADQT